MDAESGLSAQTVKLTAPSLEDQDSDLKRLAKALALPLGESTSLPVVQTLPHRLREQAFHVTAILRGSELLGIEPADDGRLLGLAVDVGTTTIAGVLVDLTNGENLAVASRTNPQATHGDDVVSRIEYAGTGEPAVRELQDLVVSAINEIAAETAEAAGAAVSNIYKLVAAGNTTMHHLLLGITPEHIGVTPFVPVCRDGWSLRASHVGLTLAPGARLYVVANISGYVGGDITAGLLAHRLHEADDSILYIDIGTNGEMALRHGGTTYACSTAAGPAFEGARISCGMRAASGAVSGMRWTDDRLEIVTLDDQPPRGICGTGLLDAAACLLELGVLDETGRLLPPGELPNSVHPSIRERVLEEDGETAFLLSAPGDEDNLRVSLTGQDIRELQLAKGSVAAGFMTLLQMAGLAEGDLDRVVLAGAFGSFLRPESAKRIGLLPAGVPLDRVEFVGNAALAGARVALLNRLRREESETLAREVDYVELSGRPDFQMLFMETMMFPMA
ncbi:MAG: ASKHA domain-containing protein [Planctomycetota bacterium]